MSEQVQEGGTLAVTPSSSSPVLYCSFILSFVLGSHRITSHTQTLQNKTHTHTVGHWCERIQQCGDDPSWILRVAPSSPSLWLLLLASPRHLPSLSPSLTLSFSRSPVTGVPGGPQRIERAGAAGNKCLIIRLIIIPGGSDAGLGRKGRIYLLSLSRHSFKPHTQSHTFLVMLVKQRICPKHTQALIFVLYFTCVTVLCWSNCGFLRK